MQVRRLQPYASDPHDVGRNKVMSRSPPCEGAVLEGTMRYCLGIAMALSAAALTIMSGQTHAQVCNLNDEPVRCFQRYEEHVRLLYNRVKSVEEEVGRIRARV